MKKILKWIAIVFGVFFAIGMIGVALETPEQKAEREAKMAAEKAEKERLKAEQAEKDRVEAEAKAKEEAEKQAMQEPEPVADFGMTPQELGKKIDQKIKDVMNVETALSNVKSGSISFDMDLGEGIIWSGNVNEHGKASATSMQMKVSPGDTQGRAMTLLLLAGATVQALHPDLPDEQAGHKVGKMANDAIQKALETQDAVTDTVMIGDIKHFIEVYPSSGMIKIGAAHKDQ